MMIKKSRRYKFGIAALLLSATLLMTACGGSTTTTNTTEVITTSSVLSTADLFTDRELEQTADLSEATELTLVDGEDITITEEGVYLISGSAAETTIVVEADEEAKVQLVLDGASITNTDKPCINVVSADKVFVTTSGDSTLSVTGEFSSDSNASATIYSAEDLVLNGTATLTVTSSDEGIRSKDDLKVTGGTYNITAGSTAMEANDSIVIADGSFTLQAGTDGMHAENSNDDTLGYVYIADGTIDIQCEDDAIHGNSVVQIDGGSIQLTGREGIEGTYVQINGGDLNIDANDDAINAGQKSDAYDAHIEINDGNLILTVDSDTADALDSNGDITINGGTIEITATSALDFEGTGTKNGGTLIINGEEVNELTPSDN